MAAAASSLKSQSQELVEAVAVFKLDTQDQRSAGMAAADPVIVAPSVRSSAPKNPAYKGPERRTESVPSSSQLVSKAAESKSDTPKPAAKAVAAGDEGDWETF